MIRMAALTHHDYTPSSRYRVRQHLPQLASQGIQVTDLARRYSTESAGRYLPRTRIRNSPRKAALALAFETANVAQTFKRVLASRRYDAVWVSRELLIGYPSFEFLLPRPFFYDIDDAVFLNRGSAGAVRTLASSAAAVFAGNEYLADYCRQYNQQVFVVPTAVDTDRYHPGQLQARDTFVVGWSGTSSSFRCFLPLQEALATFFRHHPSVIFKVCSDRFPHELEELAPYVQFEPWSAAAEVEQIQSFDVGLMPIEANEYARGKCSYKFLLYASCGVPTVCTPFGMNLDVLGLGKVGVGASTPTEWREALDFCLQHRQSLGSIFPDCRKVAIENFSSANIARQIATLMRTHLVAPRAVGEGP